MGMFDYVYGAGAYVRDSVYSGAGYVKSYVVDPRIDKKIEEIGDAASICVADKVYKALYGDPERYGKVRGTNQHVDIYYKNSPILNKLMKSATGYSIDDFINSLPLGIKQIAGPVRTYLENMIAKMLVEQISQLSVKKATVAALMAANNKTQTEIKRYLDENFKGLDEAEEALKEIIQDKTLQEAAHKEVDIRATLEEAGEEGISLMDVLNNYKAQAQAKLNHMLRDALVEGIAEAASTVAGESASYTVDSTEKAAAALGVLLGVTGALPTAVVAGGAAYASSKVKTPISDYVGSAAKQKARDAASHCLPAEIIPVDYDAMGKVTSETVTPVSNDLDLEFELLDYVQPTFTKWAEEKFKVARTALTETLNSLRKQFQYNQTHGISKIPEVMQNWFRDNDFAKLNSTREGFVQAEKALWNLDLDLMGVCEYAYGIREDINGEYPASRAEGLQLCQKALEQLASKVEGIVSQANRIATQNSRVENTKRRDDLVNPAKSRINEMAKGVENYLLTVKEAIAEAAKEEAKEEQLASKEPSLKEKENKERPKLRMGGSLVGSTASSAA